MVRFGGFPWPAALGIHLLLSLYLGLYPGLALALSERFGFLAHPNFGGGLAFAALWMGFEILRGLGPFGFPWEPLGAALAVNPYLIQPAALVGVYGLSFFLAWSNYVLFAALKTGRRARPLLFLAGGLWLANLLGALFFIPKEPPPLPLKICLVQGNVPQEVKWERDREEANLEKYFELSRKTLSAAPDLIVWPETAVTFVFPVDPLVKKLLREVQSLGRPLLFGTPRVEKRREGYVLKNSVVAISPSGKVLGIYDKERLVPFGEYVPFERWLPWLRHLAVASGDYEPGRGPGVLEIAGHRLGILICFENVFPGLARKRSRAGAEILVVVTNDAWFDRSAALPQHFYQSVLRAVETRRYVLQVANTGLSGLVDPYGRILLLGPTAQEWVACWK